MIELKQINGNIIDLSKSEKFVEHYNKPNSFAKYIIENEINNGLWYDDCLKELPEYSTIVDIGANVGLFSLYLGNIHRKYFMVEPLKNHIDVCLDVFTSLNYYGEIFEGVISNTNNDIQFDEVLDNTTCSKVSNNGKINVKSKTLLEYFNNLNIDKVDLLKLDCEGSEQQIILEDPTIDDVLKKCKVVFIEVHTQPWGNTDEQGIINKMKSLDFTHKSGKRNLSHYFINKK